MALEWDEVWRRASERMSAVTEAEARALWAAAREAGDGCWVEIGTWHARTAIVLGLAAVDRAARVVTIDPLVWYSDSGVGTQPPTPDVVLGALHHAGAGHVEFRRARSVNVASDWSDWAVSLLWIDGAHDEASVRADWEAWRHLVEPDGTVAWHDYDLPGPRNVVDAAIAAGELVLVSKTERVVVTRRTRVG